MFGKRRTIMGDPTAARLPLAGGEKLQAHLVECGQRSENQEQADQREDDEREQARAGGESAVGLRRSLLHHSTPACTMHLKQDVHPR
jgi:hypothetical protein